MKLIIKRRTIIAALRKNQLVAESWFEGMDWNDPSDTVLKPNCTGCLIGSVFIKEAKPKTIGDLAELECLINNTTTPHISYLQDIDFNLKQKKYLAALSCLFEGTMRPVLAKKEARLGKVHDGGLISITAYEKMRRRARIPKKKVAEMIVWVKKNIPVEFEVSN